MVAGSLKAAQPGGPREVDLHSILTPSAGHPSASQPKSRGSRSNNEQQTFWDATPTIIMKIY